jgi:hypothetical protein
MSPDDASVLAKILRKHINFGTSDPDGVYAASLPVKDTAGLFEGTNAEEVLAEIAGSGRTTETLKGLADAIGVLNDYAADLAADLADHIEDTVDEGNPVHGLSVISDEYFPLE